MSRRAQIQMSDAEVAEFLSEQRTLVCATNGHDGYPHLMPLWYVLRPTPDPEPGPQVWAWTYGISQKVRNVDRDPSVTLQVESGETYDQLRGVMITARAVVHRDLETVTAAGMQILGRYSVPAGTEEPSQLPEEAREMVAKQAAKRIALQFVEVRRATWDHRKLAGVY
jgi:nitroimidazol reductase NimA-like FMN-containing flavoprotein (pyridoxamine 5'-phosphate oxidase superfamily)